MTTTAPNVAPAPGTALPWEVMEDDAFDGCLFIPIETAGPTGPDKRLICEVRPIDPEDITEDDRKIAALIANAPALAAENARLIALVGETREALCQYRSDMLYPPAPDSRERRVAMIDKLIGEKT